jgi:hypothetical protein
MIGDHLRRTVCRWASPSLLAFLAPLCSAAPLGCESLLVNEQELNAVCVVPRSMASNTFRFKAHFLGSHDDSTVSIRWTQLDGMPVACRPGSKTESRFEGGEVTLDCGFMAAARSADRRLEIKISLHHLQLDRTELLLD